MYAVVRFPSPCGDEVVQQIFSMPFFKIAFPSPCGDEVVQDFVFRIALLVKFPSPCGDEVVRQSDTNQDFLQGQQIVQFS